MFTQQTRRDSARAPGIFRGSLWLIAPAVLLGATGGLFVNSYWMRDLLPLGDEQLMILTAAFTLGATVGYCLLIRWMRDRLATLGISRSAGLLLLSIAVGALLFFGGTARWLNMDRYVVMLLPRHELRLSVPPSADASPTSLVWFTTSLGDVSYDTIQAQGWKRQGEQLTLQNASANGLAWTGPTGAKVQIIFTGAKSNGTVKLAWDGLEETLSFSRTKTIYEHTFDVPFYASHEMLIVFGMLNFLVLSLALLLAADCTRSGWMPAITRAFTPPGKHFDGQDGLAILCALLLALCLRAFNLGNVFPAVDEYYHLIAAQQIVEGAALNAVYPRGLWLVTLPIALALRIFGHQLWAARLVGVLVNGLAVVPLYLLVRKINRPIAVLACVLYATSPWIITFARMAREYAYYPFHFYWIIWAMVSFVERIPPGFVLVRGWRDLGRPQVMLLGMALLLPPVFALRIDWLSTFRTVLIAYLVFGLFVLGRFNWRERLNWPVLAILGGALVLIALSWYREQGTKMLTLPTLNPVPIEYFLPNPQQQWYFDRLVIVAALAILSALAVSFLLRRVNFVSLFMLALFGSYLAVFALLSKTFFHTRHLLTTQLWYIAVAAIGLYVVWKALHALVPQTGAVGGVLLATVMGLSVLNVPQILLPTLSSNPDMPISEDYLHDLSQVQAFMLGHAQQNDVLISTVYGLYATWEKQPAFRTQYRITSQTPIAEIFSIVDENPSGWIVFDKIRLDMSGVSLKDVTGKHQIEYIGVFGDEYVWHWQRTPARADGPAVVE